MLPNRRQAFALNIHKESSSEDATETPDSTPAIATTASRNVTQ